MRAVDILKRRKDKAVAIILTVKERDVDRILRQHPGGEEASRQLRKVILDQINDFYDIALDVASSADATDYEFNPEVWVPRVDAQLAEIRSLVGGGNGKH
jgi:hypothetical protein